MKLAIPIIGDAEPSHLRKVHYHLMIVTLHGISMLENPLLDFTDTPRFADIQAEHISPAIDQIARGGAYGRESG